jgi:gliding motility-associated-like protein
MKTFFSPTLSLLFISLFFATASFSQGSSTSGGAFASPITLPLNAAGSTVGAVNDYDDVTAGGTYLYDDGPDWFYYYCATSTAPIYTTLTFTPGGLATPVLPSITVVTSAGVLVAQAQIFGDDSGTLGCYFTPVAGQCYYFIVDNNGGNGFNGFNYNINITNTVPVIPAATLQPSCSNIGFDNGTVSSWLGTWGHTIKTGLAGAPTPGYTPMYTTTNMGHHNVTTGGTDLYAPIPQVCPLIAGNTNSMRLGDGANGAYGGATIEQKFQVTAANALFTYYYALVIQDGGAVGSTAHTDQEQPFFKIEALNCAGTPIACGNYLVTGGPGIPGFTQIFNPDGSGTGTYYKNWTSVLLDLTPYIGSCVTMRFTIGDCSIGAHYAYAYLDATCGPVAITGNPSICQNTTSTFNAPSGASTYSWVNTASPGTVLSTSSSLSITPATAGSFTYQCTMTSVTGCNSVITYPITVLPTPTITVTNPPAVCSPSTVNITSASVVTISSGTGTLSYWSDAACTIPIASPGAITTSGTYYIKILNVNGCYEVKPVTVIVNTTPVTNVTTADQSICPGASVNLNAIVTPVATNTPVTFNNTVDLPIPDNNTVVSSTIAVSGITPQTVGVLPIVSVCVNFTHTWDADLDIYLQCPNGTQIQLSTGNGGSGDNYTNTCFVPTGTAITAGTAPFSGNFTPEQAFTLLNACTINGTWSLVVSDNTAGDSGTLLDWAITFNNYTPGATYAWSPTSNMTGSTTLTPTVTPTSTTTYTLTGTSPSGGCTSSDPVTITVNPLPTATITGTTTVCQNATAPTITFTGANGTAPYVFTYNINGGANQTVTSVGTTATVTCPTGTAGTFTYNLVSVSSASGCSQTQTGSAIVTVTPLPTATISGTTTVCQNATAPTITFTGANGTVPYVFTYNINGGANQTVTSVGATATVTCPTGTAGTFTYNLVSVSSANGCSQTQAGSAIVTVTPLPTATITGTTTVCQNATAPTITFTGANGTAPYVFTYNINGGANQTVTSVGTTATITCPTGTSGTFTYNLVSVSSANGCSQTQTGSAIITVTPLPTATIAGTTTVCQNATAPTITFTGANGTAPYVFTYNINGGANQTVTSVGTTATVTCPTGIAGTFTYNLVSVSSANGCSQTQAGSAIVTVTPLPTATISGTTTVCQNATAPTITFTGANGTAPYVFTYNINGGANQTVTSVGTTATVTCPTGTTGTFTYNMVSVSSANSCSQAQTGSAIVTVTPLPTATISGTTTVCQNATAPTITFTGANGTAPYVFTYNINGGANQTVTSVGATATVTCPTGTAGTFTYNLVSVSSANGCSQAQTGSAIVTVTPLPTATIAGTTTVCQNATAPTITFTGANGTAPYVFTYNINGGANQTVTSVGATATVTCPTGTAGTFTYNLVTVSSANSCSQAQTGSAIVTVTPLPTATISGTTTICQNGVAPTITFTGANGTAPYVFTYNINGGANQTVTSVGATSTVTCPTATAGTFTYNLVSVSSANGCSQVQTGSAIVTVGPLPTATISGTVTVCQNEPAPTITFTGANGTPPFTFTYNINGGANQTVTSAGAIATVTCPTATAGTFTYNLVSVSTPGGCSQTQTGSAVITVNPLPTATISGTTTLCQNAAAPTITFTGANGTAPYIFTYNINGGANQTVTSVGATATVTCPTATAGAFTYTLVSVSDASATACSQTQTGSAIITVNPLPTATISGTTTVCVNATAPTITFTGANGTAPYIFTYNINGGANQTVTSAGATATVTCPTTTAGTFTYNLVSVSDASATACSQAQTGSVVITVNPLPTATISGTTTVCENATAPTITFTGANSIAPYTFTYNINGGANQTVTSVGTTATVTCPTTTAGTFTYNLVSVSVAGGCSQAQTGSAVITINPLPTATISGTIDLCQNATSPTVLLTGANGTAPYTFTYNINGGANQTITSVGNTANITVSAATIGSFTYNLVSVQDASATGCSQAQTGAATVTVNPLPTATISGTTNLCQNAAAPQITFTGANGTAPYTFTYNINGGANQTVSTIAGNTVTVSASTATVGTFTYNLVSVQDASSSACSQTQTGAAVVTINPLPTAVMTGNASVCQNATSPIITFTGANGTAPYTFSYTINGGPTQTIASVAGNNSVTLSVPTAVAGTFTFDLTNVAESGAGTCDQNQTGTVIVTVNALPVINAGNDATNCAGQTVTLSGSGAGVGGTYTWNNGIVNNVAFTPAATATYTVTGTDANGCVGTDDVTITVEQLPIVSFTPGLTAGCAPQTITLTNTTPNVLDCVWTISDGTIISGCGTVSVVLEDPGCYDVTLTTSSANGCTNSLTQTNVICLTPAPIASFTPSDYTLTSINTEVTMLNSSQYATSYAWDFGDGNNSTLTHPTHVYPDNTSGNYTIMLVAYNNSGCTDTAYATITIEEEIIYYVPNAFTPDDDEFNQTFKPVFTSGFDPYEYTLLIFDRWGEIVFESHNADFGWDGTYGGKICQDGVYTWVIEFSRKNNDEHKRINGHVNLLR